MPAHPPEAPQAGPLPPLQRTYATVIGTAPRPDGTSYLAQTLESLRRSGWPSTLRVQVIPTEGRTRNENGCRCLEVGVASGAEWVLFLEDDILVCNDFLGSVDRWLTQHARPAALGPTLYSFYCLYGRAAHESTDGCWRYPVGWFNGCQCVALRSTDASGALGYIRPRLATWDSPAGFDRFLTAWLIASGGTLLASSPSFVQHVGRQTSLWYAHWHASPTWPGPDWTYQPAAHPQAVEEA